MAEVLRNFPDGEDVVMAILEAIAPTVQTTGDEIVAPLIAVRQVGGEDDRFNARPLIEVSYFAGTYTDSKDMAALGDQLMLAASASTVHNVPGYDNGVYVDKVRVSVSSREVSYQDPDFRRKTATYRLVMRRQRQLS